MWKSIASNALTLFIVLLMAAAALVAWGRNEFTKPGPLAQAICLKVERGASMSAVSRQLAEQGAVSDPRIFRIGASYSGRADDLKFGSYLIESGASMEQVLGVITTGGQSTCGQEVNFRIGVASADVVLRELDPATNRFVEVVKFDPSAEAVPAEYLAAAEKPDLRYRVTLAEGVTSWQASSPRNARCLSASSARCMDSLMRRTPHRRRGGRACRQAWSARPIQVGA